MNVLVLADVPRFDLRLATCLHVAGHTVHVLTTRRGSPARLSRRCRSVRHVSRELLHRLDPALLETVRAVCRRAQIELLVPADLESARFCNAFRDRLPVRLFPLSPSPVLERLEDKVSFAELAKQCGVPHPPTTVLRDLTQLDDLPHDFPVVVKPPGGANSQGVVRVESLADLRRYLHEPGPFRELPLLVQDFVAGQDLSLFLLCDRGEVVAWTLQRRDRCAGVIEFFQDEALVDYGRRLAAEVGFHGVMDVDLRGDPQAGTAVALEANPRFPGTLLYKLWAGVNLPQLGVLLAQGRDPRPLFRPVSGVCEDVGLAPGHTMRALARGRLVPPGFSAGTRRAWSLSLRDPLPHLASWAAHRWAAWRGRDATSTPCVNNVAAIYRPAESPAPEHRPS